MHGANPMKKQIYFIKYGEGDKARATIVFDYKFKIAKAEATGVFAGFTEPTWYDENGKEYNIWPFDPKTKAPFACKVGIRRKDWAEPMYVTLYLHERMKLWNGKPQAEWGNQPMHMLEKCVKSKALDQAITETAGLIIREEVAADPPPDGEWQPPATFAEAADSARTRSEATKRARTGDLREAGDLLVDDKDKQELKLVFKDLKLTSETAKGWCNEVLKALDMGTMGHLADLTKKQADALLEAGRQQLIDEAEGSHE